MCSGIKERTGAGPRWPRYLVVALVFLVPAATFGQYVVQSQVIGGGGAQTTGGGYVIHQTTAQSGPIGVSSGGSYAAHHGFWHTVGDAGPLDAMMVSILLLNPTTARLSWGAVTGATFYELYRSTTAYFTASGSPWQTVSAPTTEYSFSDGIGNTSVNYFFKGIARNASQASPESNAVGEFDFGTGSAAAGQRLIPGGSAEQ